MARFFIGVFCVFVSLSHGKRCETAIAHSFFAFLLCEAGRQKNKKQSAHYSAKRVLY